MTLITCVRHAVYIVVIDIAHAQSQVVVQSDTLGPLTLEFSQTGDTSPLARLVDNTDLNRWYTMLTESTGGTTANISVVSIKASTKLCPLLKYIFLITNMLESINLNHVLYS